MKLVLLPKESVMTVHIKAGIGGDNPIFVFLELVGLNNQSTEEIAESLRSCLLRSGFNEEYLQHHWIAFISDGASVMMGRKSGVATRLKQQYKRL